MKNGSRWRVLNLLSLVFIAFIFVNASRVFAGPGRTTYQAKIVKPDGLPLEASSVNFKFTILDPAGSCILYSETYSSVNMAATGGLISFALGSGVKTYPASATTFQEIFSNITPTLSCDAGGPGTYSPGANDIRKIVMQFHDGTGWQTLPAMSINAVPYAMYANEATKLNGLTSADFVQLSTVPTCGASEALRYTGASFNCIAVGGSGSVTSSTVVTALGYTPADGASVTTLTSNVSSVSSTLFSVSTSVTSLQSTVAASFAAITSSQWVTSGTNIFYNTGNVGIGVTAPVTKLDVSGGVRIGTESTTCAPALAGTLRYNASNVEYCNGTSWQAFGVSGAGIMNFNGSTSGTQSFATGTGGTAPNFNTSNGVHTLNIPLASTGAVAAGLLSNADYLSFSNKITSSAASIAQVLGYTPANSASSTQWITSGSAIYYNSGYVGVGTTSPTTEFDVTGSIRATASLIGANVRASTIYGANISNGNLTLESTSDSTKGSINIGSGNGNRVGIGTPSNNFAALMVKRNNATYPLLLGGATNTENTGFGVFTGAGYSGGMFLMNDSLQHRWKVLKDGAAESGSNTGSNFAIERFNDSGTTLGNALTILRSNGNIGIGTTTPVTALQVSGGIRLSMESATCATSYAGTLRYNSGSVEYCNGSAWSAFGGVVTSGGVISALGYTPANSATVSSLESTVASMTASQWVTSGSQISFSTGNVGIGTGNPTQALEVSGSIRGNRIIANDGAFNAPSMTFVGSTNTGFYNSSGSIGFSVAGALRGIMSSSSFNFNSGGAGPQIYFTGGSETNPSYAFNVDSDTGMFNPGAGGGSNELAFSTSGTEKLRISSTGNVGIGTSSPAARLSVSGGVIYTNHGGDWTNPGFQIGATNTGVYNFVGRLAFAVSGAAMMNMDSNRMYLGSGNGANFPASGSMANPDISFYRNGTSGLYSPGANQLSIVTGSLERIRVTNTGVGVGVVSPTARFQLPSGTAAANTAPLKFSSGTLLTSPESGTIEYDGSSFYVTDGTNTRRAIVTDAGNGSYTGVNTLSSSGSIVAIPTGSFVVSSTTAATGYTNGALVVNGGVGIAGDTYMKGALNVSGTTRLAGPVGIGVSNPGADLDVRGFLRVSSSTTSFMEFQPSASISGLNPGISTATAGIIKGVLNSSMIIDLLNNNTDDAFAIRYSNAGTGSVDSIGFVMNGQGRVGIGTSSPTQLLQVGAGSGSVIGEVRGGGAGYMAGLRAWNTNTASGANSFLDFGWGSSASVASIHARPQGDNSTNIVLQTSDVSGTRFDALTIQGSTGNVGIGPTSPYEKLDVNGNLVVRGQNIYVTHDSTANSNNDYFRYDDTAVLGSGGTFTFFADSARGLAWTAPTAAISAKDGFFFGSLGVGTSSPSFTVTAVGPIKSQRNSAGDQTGITLGNDGAETPKIEFNASDNSKRFFLRMQGVNSSAERLSLYAGPINNSATNEAVTFSGNGNVGIGTSSPTHKLVIDDSAASLVSLKMQPNSGPYGYMINASGTVGGWAREFSFAYNDSKVASFGFLGNNGTSDYLYFKANQGGSATAHVSPDMVIKSTGRVGIGTTAPNYVLDVNGSALIRGGAGHAVTTPSYGGTFFSFDGSTNTAGLWAVNASSSQFAFYTKTSGADAGTERLRIDENGYVGIGIDPAYKLDVGGDLRITGTPYRNSGDSAWIVPSDKRLKDVVSKYNRGLREIASLDTIIFNYKKDNPKKIDSSVKYTGVLAQEVQKQIPEAVKVEKDGFLSLNTTPIFWAMVNAIKEVYYDIVGIKAENAQLKVQAIEQARKIQSLEDENAAIKERLDRLEKSIQNNK